MNLLARSTLSLARFYLLACSIFVGVAFGLLLRLPIEIQIKAAAAAMFGCIILSIDVLVLYVGAVGAAKAKFHRIVAKAAAYQGSASSGLTENIEQLASSEIQSLSRRAVPREQTGDSMILAAAILLRSETVVAGNGSCYLGIILIKSIISAFVAAAVYHGI